MERILGTRCNLAPAVGIVYRQMDRKEFIKKACLSSACFCGFSAVSVAANDSTIDAQDETKLLSNEWLSTLISTLGKDLEQEDLRRIIKTLAITHYNHLKMDTVLGDYIGKIDEFVLFLEKNWGWKIDYDEVSKVLIADENKNFCVCPILEHKKDVDTSALCYCSEGFAEKMFSVVVGKPVRAEVVASVRRGDKSCKYRIEMG